MIMIEWVPWLLVVLVWPADAPDERQIQTIQVAVDQEECETLGAEYLEEQEQSTAQEGNRIQYLCAPMPPREDINAAYDRWRGQFPRDALP